MNGSEREQDYRLLIGTQPFDPREVGTPARRRGAAESSAERAAAREAIIVQFAAALTKPDAVRLEAAYGLKLDRYIPNLAYLERLPAETISRLRSDFLVRACIPLDPALKLAPWIGSGGGQPPDEASLVHDFAATLFDDADPAAVASALAAVGARDIKVLDDREIGECASVRFVLDELGQMSQVADVGDIVWVEPVFPITTTSVAAAATIQSGSETNTSIWDHGLHGEDQVIHVIDNGPPDMNHCFFAESIVDNPGPGHRKVLAVSDHSRIVDVPSPNDPNHPTKLNHSTFVCGIVAGDEVNNSGAHPDRGGAWAARLVCANQNDIGANVSLYRLLNDARRAGAFIHNNSWGEGGRAGRVGPYSQNARNVDLFTWQTPSNTTPGEDHLVLCSAANSVGTSPHRFTTSPGNAKNAICVGAAHAWPFEGHLGSGVAGPTLDGRRKPDLMAVGNSIVSAVRTTPNATCGTGALGGPATSWSTPHATAAAALVRQYFTEGWYPTGKKQAGNSFTPTGALLKAVLLNSTVDMDGIPGYPSDREGWGLIRLDRALYFDGAARRLAVWDVRHAAGFKPFKDSHAYDLVIVDGAEQLKVTLVWTEPAPAPMTFFPIGGPFEATWLVNNLDLKVTAPDGTQYLGNDFTDGVSTPNGRKNDSLNNVEMVVVKAPAAGSWLLEVHGVVHQGQPGQGYALVATGALGRPLWLDLLSL